MSFFHGLSIIHVLVIIHTSIGEVQVQKPTEVTSDESLLLEFLIFFMSCHTRILYYRFIQKLGPFTFSHFMAQPVVKSIKLGPAELNCYETYTQPHTIIMHNQFFAKDYS